MKRTLLLFRLLSLVAFVPVLYCLVNSLTDNIFYYISILVILISFAAIQIIQWKTGEKEKVRKTVKAMGFMAFVFILLIFIFLR